MCKCYPTKGKTVLPGRQLPIVKLLWHWNVGNILRAFICIMSLRGSLQLRRDYGGVSGEHRKWEPDQQTDFMQFCLCVPIYELYDPPLERRTPCSRPSFPPSPIIYIFLWFCWRRWWCTLQRHWRSVLIIFCYQCPPRADSIVVFAASKCPVDGILGDDKI